MVFKKVVFFPDPLVPHTTEVKTELAKSFSCYSSKNVDEYSQVMYQSGKFVLLFSDPKAALQLLKAEAAELSKLEFRTYVYLNRIGAFAPESQKILDEHKIHVFQKNQKDELLKNIHDYLASKNSDSITIDDIEFNIPGDE
jgi:hypothetical protein